MKKILIKALSLALIFIVVPMIFGSVAAGSLKFDKTTATVANGGTFQISITVDPGSDSVLSTDAYVNFDSSLLKANSVTVGTLFPVVTNDISTSGKVYITGMVTDTATPVTTSGTLATITFQALKEGTATLSFNCNTSTIVKNDINSSNVITCTQNGTSIVTIGSGGTTGGTNPTATPLPGSSGNSTAPTELPQSGVFDNVVKFAVPGMFLLLISGIFRLLL